MMSSAIGEGYRRHPRALGGRYLEMGSVPRCRPAQSFGFCVGCQKGGRHRIMRANRVSATGVLHVRHHPMTPVKIGFVLLSNSRNPLPSTRIAALNMVPFLRAAG